MVDENRQPLGLTHTRGAPVPPGQWNVVAEVWTVNSKGQVLLTLRSAEKEMYPGKWENTAGALQAGETSRQGAVRELWEETGITAAEEELVLLGSWKGGREKSFYDIYGLARDVPAEALRMQPGETTAARWVSLQELDAMAEDQALAMPVGERLGYIRQAFDAFWRVAQTAEIS